MKIESKYGIESESNWIKNFTDQINNLLEKYPMLKDSGLVVEGGVGHGTKMRNVVSSTFPKAFYVGVELCSPETESIEKVLPQKYLEGILNGQSSVLLANCFDYDLIKDIMTKTRSGNPILFSVNALGALDSPFLPGDFSKRGDYVNPLEWFINNVPYIAHIHLFRDSEGEWKETKEIYAGQTIRSAQKNGWIIEDLPSGIAVIRPH